MEDIAAAAERALRGNLHKEGEKLARQGKLFVRDRLALLLDEGSLVEDALIANASAEDLPADGVVTGVGRIDGRPVCVMANDPTVKAGSWGRLRLAVPGTWGVVSKRVLRRRGLRSADARTTGICCRRSKG